MKLDERQLLAFTELNTVDTASSIVLIHGAFSNSTTWNRTSPHLAGYHLIVPDLPGHGMSRKTWPSFSVAIAAAEIAYIVRQKGKNGKARIVGLSLGAHVALEIVTKHPDVVDQDAVLLGLSYWPQINTTLMSSLGWSGTRLINLFPESKEMAELKKMADGNTLPPMPYSYWREVCSVICSNNKPKPWSARTLIVAAGKKDGAPVADRASTARMLRDAGNQANAETVAYWNDNINHPWPVFEGKLCADMILAWIERRALPDGFVLL